MEPPVDQVIGVKAFLDTLNETMNFAFPAVTVEGEVSSFKVNQGKWVFFDLKDDDATLPCFMPVYQLKVPLEDGMKVRVTGFPKVTNWGKFSFTVRSVALAGEGEMKRAFEMLKAKLEAEGLFDEARKRQLPEYPQTIGLITSEQSDAYQDFWKILGTRWGGVTIQLAHVQVQGASAPDQVIGAINYFNQLATPPDVLVIIRGGGSLEDLQAFNAEAVARAIAASRTPTIVGVGHERDVSLADFAADRRAATPTDAARIVVPDREEVIRLISHRQTALAQSLNHHIRHLQHVILRNVSALEKFARLPLHRVETMQTQLIHAHERLMRAVRHQLDSQLRLLASFDPSATLKRGYAIVRHNDKVVTGPGQVNAGAKLVLQLAEGNLKAVADNE
ncbi:MAG TPA: exodeoxyribonuclease VII large subunit [Candidatus Saccharimonadales bacterium]|nr:exodeoxyribonuclease VII large subunit [Candidatus Saccharimonadales bacterium]